MSRPKRLSVLTGVRCCYFTLTANAVGGEVAITTLMRLRPRRVLSSARSRHRRSAAGDGISRWGTVAASHENARKAFDRGAPVLVYPGGDYETFRPSWHSDRIEFGGRKGFIKLATERGVPIVPVVAVGGQETALFVTRGERAAQLTGWAKLTRIKVLPVALAPPFGVSVLDLPPRLPLPAKVTIAVLPPIDLVERFGRNPNTNTSTTRSPAKCRPPCPSSKTSGHCPSLDKTPLLSVARLAANGARSDRSIPAHRPVASATASSADASRGRPIYADSRSASRGPHVRLHQCRRGPRTADGPTGSI